LMGNFIERQDIFGYSHKIAFNKKDTYKTIFGGVITFLIKVCVIYQALGLILSMVKFQKDSIQVAETALDFASLGEVKMNRLGDVPFYSFKLKNKYLMRTDANLCKGDCYSYLS